MCNCLPACHSSPSPLLFSFAFLSGKKKLQKKKDTENVEAASLRSRSCLTATIIFIPFMPPYKAYVKIMAVVVVLFNFYPTNVRLLTLLGLRAPQKRKKQRNQIALRCYILPSLSETKFNMQQPSQLIIIITSVRLLCGRPQH